MKKLIFISVIVLAFLTGCKKEDETDPRDQFVGKFTVTQTISIPGIDYTDILSGTYTITKHSTDTKRIIINDGDMDIIATVEGNTYSYDKFTIVFNDGTDSGSEEVTGEGVINGNKINETGTVLLSMYGESYAGTWTAVCNRQ